LFVRIVVDTTNAVRALRITALAALALVAVGAVGTRTAHAEPEVTDSNPPDGAVLEQLPTVLGLCFSEAVVTEGENPWRLVVRPPAGQSVGLRIVFNTDGNCVDVFPSVPEKPEGIWQVDWQVRAQSDESEGSGTILFQVGALQPGETPLPAPVVQDEDDDPSARLIALAGVGMLIVVVGAAGLYLRRRRT
jgi:methionine-rich copper-binding protein CopC